MTIDLTRLNLADATPIDFDDIREGDTVLGFKPDGVVGFIVPGTDAPYVDAPGNMWYCARDGYTWFLLSRPEPTVEPGTTGTATVRGQHGVRVYAFADDDNQTAFFSSDPADGQRLHPEHVVADFVADPKPISDALATQLDILGHSIIVRDDDPIIVAAAHDVLRAYRAWKAGDAR